MLEDLLEYYRKSDGAIKKKILGSIFAEKLVLEKGKVVDPVFTEPIQLILRISEVLGSSDKKKEVDFEPFSGCNSIKKLDFSEFKSCNPLFKKIHTSHPYELVRVSECHKKKQEVGFDLLCRWVPRTDKSCNHLNEIFILFSSI